MQMPKVSQCQVTRCAYNLNNTCHAQAITIGDDTHPMCDTFCGTCAKVQDASTVAAVGACKVEVCSFNEGLECQAPGISVGMKGKEPDCLTFRPRQ